jgi:hypothetical protein
MPNFFKHSIVRTILTTVMIFAGSSALQILFFEAKNLRIPTLQEFVSLRSFWVVLITIVCVLAVQIMYGYSDSLDRKELTKLRDVHFNEMAGATLKQAKKLMKDAKNTDEIKKITKGFADSHSGLFKKRGGQ